MGKVQKKVKKKTNNSTFPATHTYIKLTLVSFFLLFFLCTFPLEELCNKSYIKDERRSVIGGSDDTPHKPTSLPDQGGHLINNWSTPGPSPGTQSCQPHPPPGPPPPPPSAPWTAPRDYWPPPPRCGWRSAGRGPGMLSVEQAQVLAICRSRASKQFSDSKQSP